MSEFDKLYNISLKAMCIKCSNYTVIHVSPFGKVLGCRCGIEPTKCVLAKDILGKYLERNK